MRIIILGILLCLVGCSDNLAGFKVGDRAVAIESCYDLDSDAKTKLRHTYRVNDQCEDHIHVRIDGRTARVPNGCFEKAIKPQKIADSKAPDLKELMDILKEPKKAPAVPSKYEFITEYHQFLNLCSKHGEIFKHSENPVVDTDILNCAGLGKAELLNELRIVEKYKESLK